MMVTTGERGLSDSSASTSSETSSSASSEISVFLSPDWTEVWLQHFGDTVRPSGLVWTIGDGTPVGCALYSQQTAKLGPFNVTRLFVNACGDHLTGMEYNEIPALPGYRDAVLSDFVAYVLESGADELALTGFKSEIAATICEKWPSRSCEGYVSESPFVALNRLREEKRHYLESLSANTRSNVRRTLRAYTNHYGEPTLRRAADSNEAISWFEQMVKLHDARWKDKGKPGAFSGAHVNSFYKNLIRSSVENADGMTRMRLDLCGFNSVSWRPDSPSISSTEAGSTFTRAVLRISRTITNSDQASPSILCRSSTI